MLHQRVTPTSLLMCGASSHSITCFVWAQPSAVSNWSMRFFSQLVTPLTSSRHIIINKNGPILSNTYRRFESFRSSIAYPYHNAGYETIFVTGGKLGWRNLRDLIPNQFFKKAYGKSKIIKNYHKDVKKTSHFLRKVDRKNKDYRKLSKRCKKTPYFLWKADKKIIENYHTDVKNVQFSV